MHPVDKAIQSVGVKHHFSNNNLHISCEKFDFAQAGTVLTLLELYHKDCQRIFIDVRNVAKPHSAVANMFKAALRQAEHIAPRQILFKGAEGFDLAIDGHRVLVPEKKKNAHNGHVCCGRCAHCTCKRDEMAA